jgi:lauroyl/myristoyl acyltransferase
MIKYLLMVAGSFLVGLLPPALSSTLSVGVADIAWALSRGRRATLAENYRLVFGAGLAPGGADHLTRSAFRHLARNVVDFLRFPRLSPRVMRAMTSVEGVEHLRRSMEGGKGAIFVTGHVGNWELGGGVLASYGFPTNVVAESIAPGRSLFARDRIGQLYARYRRAVGMKVIPLESGGPASYRCLRRGGLLVLLGDRDISGTGIAVTMFGGTARVPRGPAVLSLRLGAPIITGCLVRDRSGRYHGIVDPAIAFQASGDFERDVRELTKLVVRRLERYVRRFPDQWFVFERVNSGEGA